VSRIHFVIDSDLGEVSLVAMAVNRICIHLGLDEIQASEVELCVAEAVTNAIRHAYHGAPGRTVSIAVSPRKQALQIDVFETGTPMGDEHVERLLRGAKSIEAEESDRTALAEGGRGLQIIHDLMDEVAYSREGSLNRLRLTKRIGTAKPN
jgi:serine/threonine-protein kinase RsbW